MGGALLCRTRLRDVRVSIVFEEFRALQLVELTVFWGIVCDEGGLLTDERVGNLCIITSEAATTGRVKSQIKLLVRQAWSNPPTHGCRIVATVLNNPALYAEWLVICGWMV